MLFYVPPDIISGRTAKFGHELSLVVMASLPSFNKSKLMINGPPTVIYPYDPGVDNANKGRRLARSNVGSGSGSIILRRFILSASESQSSSPNVAVDFNMGFTPGTPSYLIDYVINELSDPVSSEFHIPSNFTQAWCVREV